MSLAPNNDNYLWGSGKFYFKEDGQTNYLHMGNTPKFEITMEPEERLEHWESQTDKKHKDVDDVLKFSVMASVTLEEYSKEIMDIIIRGDGVQSLGNQSASNLDASSTTIEDDKYVDLGYTDLFVTKITYNNLSGTFDLGETVTGGTSSATGKIAWRTSTYMELINVSGTFQAAETLTGGTSSATATSTAVDTMDDVVVNDAASPTERYVRGTDYDIDTVGGLLCIFSSSSATTPVYVSADYPAKTNRTVRALAGDLRTGEILFIGDPRRGPRWRVQGWKVNINLTGPIPLITDDVGQIEIELAFLSDSDNHPSDPYFKATLAT